MDRAPFEILRLALPFDPTPCPGRAGARLVDAFMATAGLADPVSQVQRALAEATPARERGEVALAQAAAAIATHVDREAAHFDRLAYHNRQHFCEVMLTAGFLCRRQGMSDRSTRLVVAAALIHDLEHDGKPGAAFEYERRSIERAAPFLRANGVGEEEIARIGALVLATEPGRGVAAAVAVHGWHLRGRTGPARPSDLPGLEPLAGSPELARAAVVLCEADILPSVGLTLDHAMALQHRLATEWQRSLGRDDKLRFLDAILEAGVVGSFFLPNVRALRRTIAGLGDALAG